MPVEDVVLLRNDIERLSDDVKKLENKVDRLIEQKVQNGEDRVGVEFRLRALETSKSDCLGAVQAYMDKHEDIHKGMTDKSSHRNWQLWIIVIGIGVSMVSAWLSRLI